MCTLSAKKQNYRDAEMSANTKKIRSLLAIRFGSLKASVEAERKKVSFKKPWQFNKKTKGILVLAVVAIMLVSIFAFLPKANQTPFPPQSTDDPTSSPTATAQPTRTSTPSPWSQIQRLIPDIPQIIAPPIPKAPGTIQIAGGMNSSVWRAVALNAWNYFQPGTGVDANTGLPYAGGTDSPNFTDWDLGVYVQAVIDANKTGLIGTDGGWTASARLEKVVSFLENRTLNQYNYPFWFYQARDGKDYKANSDAATGPVDAIDTGRLFVALNNLKAFNSSLAQRIDTIVKGPGNRSDYHALVANVKSESATSNSIYFYYVACGFAAFWPSELSSVPDQILTNIINSGNVTTPDGAQVPKAGILGDPLYCSVFEVGNTSKLMTIAYQVYHAHEAYYGATGQYRAFSEGASLSDHWTYEWVVMPDGRTWVVLDEKGNSFGINPIIYTKIALSFLAIYNSTYALDMSIYLEQTLPNPSSGYGEGVDESGMQLSGSGLNTNGMILGAANYAIKNNP
jgi:hypothetical protein